MRSLFAAVLSLGLGLFASAAWAQDAMDATFGNTVTVSSADGTVLASYFFESDGTFTQTGADGTSADGTWSTETGELCMTVGETTGCNPLDGSRAVGDSWEDTTEDGTVLTIAIVEGR